MVRRLVKLPIRNVVCYNQLIIIFPQLDCIVVSAIFKISLLLVKFINLKLMRVRKLRRLGKGVEHNEGRVKTT